MINHDLRWSKLHWTQFLWSNILRFNTLLNCGSWWFHINISSLYKESMRNHQCFCLSPFGSALPCAVWPGARPRGRASLPLTSSSPGLATWWPWPCPPEICWDCGKMNENDGGLSRYFKVSRFSKMTVIRSHMSHTLFQSFQGTPGYPRRSKPEPNFFLLLISWAWCGGLKKHGAIWMLYDYPFLSVCEQP